MIKKERVFCPAVRLKARNMQEDVLCLSYDDIYVQNAESTFKGIYESGGKSKINGFVTNLGRFVDPKEAMRVAIKSGQYPNYAVMKLRLLEEIECSRRNRAHNKSMGIFDGQLYVADISELEGKIKAIDKLSGRDYLVPEDILFNRII